MAAKNLDDLKSQELTKGAEEIEDRRVDPLYVQGPPLISHANIAAR